MSEVQVPCNGFIVELLYCSALEELPASPLVEVGSTPSQAYRSLRFANGQTIQILQGQIPPKAWIALIRAGMVEGADAATADALERCHEAHLALQAAVAAYKAVVEPLTTEAGYGSYEDAVSWLEIKGFSGVSFPTIPDVE